ncbi:MAG: hypothetical protein LBC87_02115 [Fibromonadaceae bacterium]|jgi:hypothetical protein|nr:hypothetical protein [Fibromonadaceae bacterium]
MLCKECTTCFWFNSEETRKDVSNCDDHSQNCTPINRSQVFAIAKELTYKRNAKSDNVLKPSILDVSQALLEIYGKKRKTIPNSSIEKVLKRWTMNA